MTVPWAEDFVTRLKDSPKVRVSAFGDLLALARESRAGLSIPTFRGLVSSLIKEGVLLRPAHGLYLNGLAVPKPGARDIAGHIRKGSVIGLRSVLAPIGAVPTGSIVTAVLPFGESRPNLGEVVASGGRFRFYGLPSRFFPSDPTHEWYAKTPYPSFTPEKSLVDWLHLGASGRSNLPPPPLSLDETKLDMGKVALIAHALDVVASLDEWNLRRVAARAGRPQVKVLRKS